MFNQYPYLNLNDLNLDYILRAIKEMRYEVTNFVSINAIKYADPIQWNITSQYEKNTIVIDPVTGTAYISVAPVPAGVALTRTEYWTVVFDLGSFVTRAAQNFTSRWESDTTTTATFSTPMGGWLVWGDVLYKALVNITAGDAYVVNSNIEHFTIEDIYDAYLNTIAQILAMVGDLADLATSDTSDIVHAINSVLSDLNTTIGDLADLNTTDKSSIVNAINEVNTTGGGALAKIGDLDDLTTSDKSTVVNAINELDLIIKNLEIYNVKNYGAAGDGVTDDTQAIIDCLAANHVVYFPTGTYIISSTIYVDSFDTLIGEDKNNTIIKMADGVGIDMIKSVGFDSLKGTDDHTNKQHAITIAHLTIDGNYRVDPDDLNVGATNNTAGTGVCLYAGGIMIVDVCVYNCADDGMYTEWNSYLTGSVIAIGQESRFESLTIKSNGKNGWDFHGPHDSDISNLICATNNKKGLGAYNLMVSDGGFKMVNSHLYSDYGLPKVYAPLYVKAAADPLVITNCDIEGGLNSNLLLENSNNLFANCRFYECYGGRDIYIAPNAKNNTFVACYCGAQATQAGITPPQWRGAVEFSDAQATNSHFDIVLINTFACDYYAGDKYNTWIIHGYNTQDMLDGYYRAIPDPYTYTRWLNDNIIISGDFDDQDNLCVLNTRTPLNSAKYDTNDSMYKYFDGANYVGALNDTRYSSTDRVVQFFDGANFVTPDGAVRYYSGNLQRFDGGTQSWINIS